MDPIATNCELAGEPVTVRAPASTTPYRPGDSADYQPGAPVSVDYVGVPEARLEYAQGAVAAVTVSTDVDRGWDKVDGLKVEWRGNAAWKVLKVRKRTWAGVLNGYTFYLAI